MEKFLTVEIKHYRIPIAYVLYPFGKSFKTLIGREDEMHSVKEFLNTPMPVSIIGHGGLGKTALVMQLVEDYIYLPSRPFENIFFFSFKDNNFSQGKFTKIDKIIQNYNDVLKKLSDFLNLSVDFNDPNFEDMLWDRFFETKSLLILDNLETEIVQSNLEEFVKIANRFIMNYAKNCRLLITSRSGIGNNEQKITLNPFSLVQTKELVKTNSKNLEYPISNEDWDWIQDYTKGNPGLINALCYSLTSTSKSIKDLRIEYNSKYTEESLKLHEQQETFIRFCFENTLESLPQISKQYLAAICYICSATITYEVSEAFLSYIKEHIFSKRIHPNLDTTKFTNIGFLQPISYSAKYRVNEFFVLFLDGNLTENDDIVTTFDIQKSSYAEQSKSFIDEINEIQFNKTLDIEEIMTEIYINKFKVNKNIEFAFKAFFSSPNLSRLNTIFSNLDALSIIENRNFIEKVSDFKNPTKDTKLQERIINLFVNACFDINDRILKKKSTNIKQSDLIKYYFELESKITILKTYNISDSLKAKICRFLNSCSQYKKVIEIAKSNEELSGVLLISYTKLISKSQKEKEIEDLLNKAEVIVQTRSKFCSKKSIYIYKICSLQHHLTKQNFPKVKSILREIENYEPTKMDTSTYALKLEVEFLKLEYFIKANMKPDILSPQFSLVKRYMNDSLFSDLYLKNQQRFQERFDRLKSHSRKRNSVKR
ncbi:NB-ARC domain-containing protein [Ureibacillus composti]